MNDLPSGTVTMLFTDIEGSTSLVRTLEDEYGAVLADYRRLLRAAVGDAGGREVDCRADELFAAFQRANDAVAAALSAQRALSAHAWPDGTRVAARMGLHTGEPAVEGGVYLGLDVHRAVRICAAGHGGQILLSQVTHDLVGGRFETRDLGAYSLAGLTHPERIYQLLAPQLRDGFPPLRAPSPDHSRFRGRPPRAPAKRQTLAETAWQVRALLPGTATALQQPLAELGAAFFTADRAARGADKFLERVDDKRLARRLARERKGLSTRARQRAESLEKQVACLDRLRDRWTALVGLALDASGRLGELRTVDEIEGLRERIDAVTEEVDDALGQAARTLDPLSYKLRRTRQRGIYHSASKYAVPFVDETGDEQLREFDTLTEARAFRAAVRVAEKKQHDYQGALFGGEIPEGQRHGWDFTRGDDGRPRH
jgi:class 3 adenylate cyclase